MVTKVQPKNGEKQPSLQPVISRSQNSQMQKDYKDIIPTIRTKSIALSSYDILQLQRTVGNQAVGRYLQTLRRDSQSHGSNMQPNVTHTSTTVQRYEGPEHQYLGDEGLQEVFEFLRTRPGQEWAKKYGLDPNTLASQIEQDPMRRGEKIELRSGLRLTPGEIIALMGDFYGSWTSLTNAPPAKIAGSVNALGQTDRRPGVLDIMDQERRSQLSGTDAAVQYERITHGRYLRLAKENDTHFAPKNRHEWHRLHLEAIAKAREAARNNAKNIFQEALLIDAAGGHFLTDAFASGHLFDKQRVQAQIAVYLLANPIRSDNPEMQGYVDIIEQSGNLGQLVLKNIHDRMNREGFEVSNQQGMRWKTYGDNNLKNAKATRHIASLAVFLSRRQIQLARRGESPNPQEILDFLPDNSSVERATEQAINFIPEAARQVPNLIYSNRGMAGTQFGPVLGAIVESHLSTVGNPGRRRQLEDLQQHNEMNRDRRLQAPLFTIGEW